MGESKFNYDVKLLIVAHKWGEVLWTEYSHHNLIYDN